MLQLMQSDSSVEQRAITCLKRILDIDKGPVDRARYLLKVSRILSRLPSPRSLPIRYALSITSQAFSEQAETQRILRTAVNRLLLYDEIDDSLFTSNDSWTPLRCTLGLAPSELLSVAISNLIPVLVMQRKDNELYSTSIASLGSLLGAIHFNELALSVDESLLDAALSCCAERLTRRCVSPYNAYWLWQIIDYILLLAPSCSWDLVSTVRLERENDNQSELIALEDELMNW